MTRLDSVFYIKNGIASSNLQVHSEKTNNRIAYIRPSKQQKTSIAGYIDISSIDEKHIYPKGTLYVSTDGEGSHTYAYVSVDDFIANSNVSILIPKEELTLNKKLYYAMCITKNRYKFSYGRKPKGNRLASVIIPSKDKIPKWINDTTVKRLSKAPLLKDVTPKLDTSKWKEFCYNEIFDIQKGKRLTKKEQTTGSIPYISSSGLNNGVDNYINNGITHKAPFLTIACYGSIGEVFFHNKDSWVSDNCNVLFLKNKNLTPYIALFLCTVIYLEKFRYDYGFTGQSSRMKKSIIKLPVDSQGNPDWDYMENYIKTLPYSSSL